jgi:acyl-CoA reductase-like NAD-dependent aldehyde dehydrogenase
MSPEVRVAYLAAHEQWSSWCRDTSDNGGRVLCGGGPLECSGDEGIFAAPALFTGPYPVPALAKVGPMLVVVPCTTAQAHQAAVELAEQGGEVILVGGRAKAYPAVSRHIQGALLVERLPAGLPEPRPV